MTTPPHTHVHSKRRGARQVFISYGERSNDQLLQYYGFVERCATVTRMTRMTRRLP